MSRTRRPVTVALLAAATGSAGLLAAAPAGADSTGAFHASWFRGLAETRTVSSAATLTVPTATCGSASGSALRIEYGVTGRKVDRAAAALGRVTVTCAGTTPSYVASIRVDYRDSGVGSVAVAPGDRLRVTSATGTGGATVTLTSQRTGQTLRYSGAGLVSNGVKITVELRDAPRFSPIGFADATVDGAAFGSPRPSKSSQTDSAGRIIAEPTEFTDAGRTTTIADRR